MMPTTQPAYTTLSQAPSLTVSGFLCAVVLCPRSFLVAAYTTAPPLTAAYTHAAAVADDHADADAVVVAVIVAASGPAAT